MSTSEDEPRWGEPSITYDPDLLSRFEARPTDVLITTAAKAGTTWMQQLLHQLRSGGDVGFRSIYDVVPWLEFTGRRGLSTDERLAAYEAIPDPRIFKTHLLPHRMPGATTAKLVIVSRDPRDCCVSAYHHLHDMTPDMHAWLDMSPPGSFDEVFEMWIEGSWFKHVSGWWPHREADNVCWLRFEDMKRDLPGVVETLVAFLGWSVSDEQRARALEVSSFAWMSENRERFTRFSGEEDPSWKPKTFIRKGAVGDHRGVLGPEHERRILEKARATLEPECLAFFGLS